MSFPKPPIRDIDSPAALRDAAARWRKVPALAVDTEFVRERTFYPALGLVQISDGESVELVDPVALNRPGDLDPLAEVLADDRIVKVLHSCGEDLEVLHHRLGLFPRPLFDTQIAAAFCGHGFSVGYGGLVAEIFGVELPKGQTRTNWIKRPLTPEQRDYAALDAIYLVPAYTHLLKDLERLGRARWAADDTAELFDLNRFAPDPQDVWAKIRGRGRLNRRQLAALRELAAWRETEARRRDLPRGFLVKDGLLVEIARRMPETPAELGRLRDLDSKARRRWGSAILDTIERARGLESSELPENPEHVDLTPHRKMIDRLRTSVKRRAEELELPPELLATRRTVESVMRRHVTHDPKELPRELRGWRREVVGEQLLEILGTK